METPNDRLRLRIEKDGGTLKEWCLKYGADYKTIQLMTSGARTVTQKKLATLEENVPDFDAFHILHGVMKYSNTETNPGHLLTEPGRSADPFEDLLLRYLNTDTVKKEIGKIALEQLLLQIKPGKENSELIARLQELMK